MAATAVKDDIEFRSVSFSDFETRLNGDDEGTFAGYACRFNVVDSYGTTFAEHCWSSGGLDGGTYALLSMHDEKHVVGAFTATEDENGLFIRGRYDDTPEGHAARARAKSGSAGELSVGFLRTGVDPADPDRITGARLYEVSQITARMASQPNAALTMVRSAVDKKVDGNDELKPETVIDTPTGEVDTAVDAEPPEEDNSDLEQERAAKPTCRACGKGVRKFICSRCLQSGIKGGNTTTEERMDVPNEVRAMSTIPGSYEERQNTLRSMLTIWMTRAYGVSANDSYVSLDATFDDSVVYSVGSWADDAPDALVAGQTWRTAYVVNDGDGITLGEPVPAELVTVVRDDVPALEVRTEEKDVDGETPDGDGKEVVTQPDPAEETQESQGSTGADDEQNIEDDNDGGEPERSGDNAAVDGQRQRARLRLRLLNLAS